MKMLVLDKSVVVATPRDFLKNHRDRFDFLLTDTLHHEIFTEKLDQWDSLCPDERTKTRQRIHASFRKAQEGAGNLWVDNERALGWEITEGCSARHAPTRSISFTFTPSNDMFSEEWKRECLKYDAKRGKLMSVVHAPVDQNVFERVRSLREEELFHQVRQDYSSERFRNSFALDAKTGFSEHGARRGLKVAPGFAPGAGWFSFGIIMASFAYLRWKFWKYGDDPPDRKSPANPYFDMVYVSYIAIADGILSSDKNLLKIAWACYPEKEEDLYEFDTQTHEIATFKPQWSS